MNRPASLLLLLALLAPLAACSDEGSPDGEKPDGGGASMGASAEANGAGTTDSATLRSLPENESLLFAL